jgi:hypothetical protein
MMKAARESDTRCDKDSAKNQKAHDSTPVVVQINHKGFFKKDGGIFATGSQ